MAAVVPARAVIPAGTTVQVRTNETIDLANAAPGRVFSGEVAQNVMSRNGRVMIPKGSPAALMVTAVSKHHMTLDLSSITVGGQTYTVASTQQTVSGAKKPGVGKNKRTAKFLGIGAAGGVAIGAIAGGGVGAVVGGVLGGGGGAAAQTLTRKKQVRVPAESLLTFQLEQPLR